jgi:hypothetical protein
MKVAGGIIGILGGLLGAFVGIHNYVDGPYSVVGREPGALWAAVAGVAAVISAIVAFSRPGPGAAGMGLSAGVGLVAMQVAWVVPAAVLVIAIVFSVIGWRLGEKREASLRTCPYCRSKIPREASVCRYCQRELAPAG